MLNNERTSVQLNKEKVEKTKKSTNLKAESVSLTKSIQVQQANKKNLEGQLWNTNQQLTSTNQNINAQQTNINNLNARVNQLNGHINGLNNKIAEEAKKRKCIMGIGKRRRRR